MQGVTDPMQENEEIASKKFRDDLLKFHQETGNTSFRIPQIGGKELDCFKLYNCVTSRGGYEKVTLNKEWKNIVHEFDLPASCTSASYTLKHHYFKCLLNYERKNFSGSDLGPMPTSRTPQNTISDIMPKKHSLFHSDYMAYGNYVASVNTASRNAAPKKVKLEQTTVESKRLVLAFESHVLQEVNWALNIMTVFSCNISVPFLLENNPFLLDSMSNYLEYCAMNVPSLKYVVAAPMPTVSDTLEKETKMPVSQNDLNARVSARLKKVAENMPSEFHEKNEDVNLFALDKKCLISNKSTDIEILLRNNIVSPFELLRAKKKKCVDSMYEDISELNYLEHIKQILLIIRNLSYVKANEHYIIKTTKFVEILLALFTSYTDAEITTTGLECICNISKHIILADYSISSEFLKTLMECLNSPIQSTKDTAIETFRRISLSTGNEDYLESMPPEFLKHLVNLMASPNFETREAALEILCPISDRKISTKVKIAKEPRCIKRLIALLCSTPESIIEEKISKLSALTLANLSLAPAIKDQLMIYEPELAMVACSDKRISDIICNMLAELESYQLAKPHLQS